MIFTVRVMPRAGRSLVREEGAGLKVYLTQPPAQGRANLELIAILSEYLRVKKRNIEIIKGHNSRNKLVKINA